MGHEVEMMMFGEERRSARVLLLGVMLLVCTGCTSVMDRIPQVAGTKSPWTERYRFEFIEGKNNLGEAQLGIAEVVTKSYTLRYVPDADSQKGLLENGQSYLVLGDLKLSFEHERRMQDVAKPISIRVMERFHELTAEQESNAMKSGWNEYRWKGMNVRLDTLNLWHPNREKPYVGGLIGNHAEVLRTATVQKDGRNLFYLEVERDRYDEKTMSYNGEMNYEYWLVAVYEDESALRLSEDRQTALTLVLTSEKKELPGAKAQLLELAKTWSLPPEDIFMK